MCPQPRYLIGSASPCPNAAAVHGGMQACCRSCPRQRVPVEEILVQQCSGNPRGQSPPPHLEGFSVSCLCSVGTAACGFGDPQGTHFRHLAGLQAGHHLHAMHELTCEDLTDRGHSLTVRGSVSVTGNTTRACHRSTCNTLSQQPWRQDGQQV